MESKTRIDSAFWILRLGLGASTFLAGADKFTNLLTNWEKYIAPEASNTIPMSDKNFLRAVGAIEMLVGVGILSSRTRLSSYAASGWLLAIAANLCLNKDYDVAVRDVNMAIAAFALAQLSAARKEKNSEQPLAGSGLRAA